MDKTNKSIKRRFIDDVYNGDEKAYRQARKADYLKVQYEWTCYVDNLCKNGEITEKEANNTLF